MHVPVNRIIWNDAAASGALIAMLCGWVVALLALLSLLGGEAARESAVVGVALPGGLLATLSGLVLIGVRVRRLRGLLAGGRRVAGRIDAIETGAALSRSPFDRRLRFSYQADGRTYVRAVCVRQAAVAGLKARASVTVLHDPARPARALVGDLYGRR